MREILLALILAGAGLQLSTGAEQQAKDSDVKYSGPVVYTNLPPPVLYFPNFPQKQKFSNRGSSGDTEDKRVEYVPFPYKDLPLLVYQSESQPPVHVVEKGQNSEKDDAGPSGYGSGYQTGTAMYRLPDSDQHVNEQTDTMNQPQGVVNSNDKYINVDLGASQIPQIDVQNQQYISIGVTAINPQQTNDAQNQPSYPQPTSSQQTSSTYSQMQYSSNQNADDYLPQGVDTSGQGGQSYMYYQSQAPSQNAETQAPIVPVDQLTQAIKNYLIQHNSVQQQARQTLVSAYSIKQDSYASPSEKLPTQHVGITIIRQPSMSDGHESDGSESQYSAPPSPPPPAPVQMNSNEGYDDNPQYVSIGVFPINLPGQDQQYYNIMAPAPSDQYQSASDDYRQDGQVQEKPPMVQNENAQPAGYQLISIDLSALKNQNAEQQGNTYSEYPKQVLRPPPVSPPPKPYRPQSEEGNSYNSREKEFQQIFIQIPENILSKQ